MTMVVEGLGRWQVSTQGLGELLTTMASIPELDLRLLGRPSGYEPAELQSWLEGLARAVGESRGEGATGDPVPPMLRHALGGMLFSHGELWDRGPGSTCSVVLVGGPGRIAFGWVGEASAAVYPEASKAGGEWVSIRDAQGREARAWCGAATEETRIELLCSPLPDAAQVRLEARWIPASHTTAERAEPTIAIEDAATAPLPTRGAPHEAISTQTQSTASSAAEQASSELPEAPSTGVARWLAQHVQWGAEAPPTTPITEAVTPPELDAELLSAAAAIESAIGGPPPSLGAIEPDVSASGGARLEPVLLPKDLPELIPPTPEPEALTAEALSGLDPAPRRAPPRHPEWPIAVPQAEERPPLPWKSYAAVAVVIAGLFGVGWMLGSVQGPEGPAEARHSTGLVRFLRGIGLAPARFDLAVASRPPGAWISVDGKELSLRAPAQLELAPGSHRIGLSFPDLGGVVSTVVGAKSDQLSVTAPLWGSLDVAAADPTVPVSLALDGQPLGLVPTRVDSLAPGPHELRFSGPGMASWGSTLEVKVGEHREVLAYPLQSPATGLIQVRATLAGEDGAQPLPGARVWVDGESRGVTPLTLELPRGPHSVRVAYQQEEAPIQVIDLPGGNQRFATFELGLHSELPVLLLRAPASITMDEPALVSATLTEVAATDVREMWLHVREPENRWRRYPMTLMDAQGSAVGAAPFPAALLGADGKTLYYVSAVTAQGDEYFTEMQTARGAPAPRH